MNAVSADALMPGTMPTPTAPESAPVASAPGAPAAAPAAPISPTASAETDSAGRAFDPAKHLPRKNPTSGRWMPKGGRKPRTAAPAPGAAPSVGESGTPAAEVKSFIPSSVPPPPPEEGAPAGAAPQPAAPGPDNSEDAGEVGANLLQFVAGIVFDSPADCECTAPEHRRLVSAFAGYIRSRGWQASAGVLVGLVIAAYFFRVLRRDKPREKLRTWIYGAKAEAARNVTPDAAKPASVNGTAPAAPSAKQPAPAAPVAPVVSVATLGNFEVIE